MNLGLLGKTLREVRLGTILTALGLFGANILLTVIIPKIEGNVGRMFERFPFAKDMLQGLLGTDFGGDVTSQAMSAVLWVHPIVLALLWFHAISLSTRFPAGETERGTVDFLLGLPVSRRQVYWTEVMSFCLTGLLLIATGYAGHRFASPAMPEYLRPDAISSLMIMTNMYCVYLAVGSIGFLVSSLNSKRGQAIGIVFALVLVSFLLNFVAQFWEEIKSFAFLGILRYYRPAIVLSTHHFPVADVVVLLAIALVCLIAGSEVAARRSICTT